MFGQAVRLRQSSGWIWAAVAGIAIATACLGLSASVGTWATGARPAAAVAGLGTYVPVTPFRMLETRNEPANGIVPIGGPGRPFGAGETRDLQVAGVGSIPLTNVTAIVLNVTVIRPSTPGYATLWPKGSTIPKTSNLNFVSGQVVPNLVEIGVGNGGMVSIYSTTVADMAADVAGYVSTAAGSSYYALSPQRILDSRNPSTYGLATWHQGTVRKLIVAGKGGVPTLGTDAVVLNVTVTNGNIASYLTLWPDDQPQPTASNINWVPGLTVPNRVVVKLGADGGINIYNRQGDVDVVADVNAYFSSTPLSGSGFHAVTPDRLLDTRPGPLNIGPFSTPFGSGETRTFQVAGAGSLAQVPADPSIVAVVLNVTVVDGSNPGFLSLWPHGSPPPQLTSDLNWAGATAVPNLVVVALSSNGQQVDIYHGGAGTVDVVMDVVGYYQTLTGSPPSPSPSPTPSPSPSACGAFPNFPNANCTGFQPTGVSLSGINIKLPNTACVDPSQDCIIRDDNAVVDGMYTKGGAIIADANNVTIKRSHISCTGCYWVIRQTPGHSGLTIQDTEIDRVSGSADYGISIEGGNATINRVDIHNVTSGIHVLANNTTISDSFIHGLVNISGADHNDAILVPGTIQNTTILHNNLQVPIDQTSPLAIYDEGGGNNGVYITNNLVNGGGFCIYAGNTGTNIQIKNNYWGRLFYSNCGYYGLGRSYQNNAGNVWSGNTLDDGTTVVPPPTAP